MGIVWVVVVRGGGLENVVGVDERFAGWVSSAAAWVERLLAVVILVVVVVAACRGVVVLARMDWGSVDMAYELVYRVLSLVIAVELARTLVTHSLDAVLELLAFVIARKMLSPDATTVDVLLSVTAFVGLLAGRRWLVPRDGARVQGMGDRE